MRALLPTLLLSTSLLVACRSNGKVPQADGEGLADADADADGDGVPASEDCDDADPTINSGALEICDGLDNDCDGLVDEEVTTTFFEDADGDSYGDPDAFVEACAPPAGTVSSAGDCDDGDPRIFPGANELCNGLDDDCNGAVDDGLMESWYLDADGDGFGDPSLEELRCAAEPGWVQDGTDCDDTTAAAYPDAVEFCDELDNDCDGDVDEGVTNTYWADNDGDGWGVDAQTTEACSVPLGYADAAGDCDDGNLDINPGRTELCNSVDDDCDGTIDEDDAADAADWWLDGDGDGAGVSTTVVRACTQPAGTVASGGIEDCDDGNPTTYWGAPETCDGEDDDCDGTIDEDDAIDASTWWLDVDGDTHGGTTLSLTQCTQPAGYVGRSSDCDDSNAAVFPGATETCNDTDDDCDGSTDEGLDQTWYRDNDGDGYGTSTDTESDCAQPAGYVSDSSDCDDGDDEVNPAATELCFDDVDNDCSGSEDDHATCYTVDITTDAVDVNLWDEAGSPTGAVSVYVTVASGVTVSASDTATPAMTTDGFDSGTLVIIENLGTIHGAGGDGACQQGGAGEDGGDALEVTVDVELDTSVGGVYGGGGGGGAGDDPAGGGGGAGGGLGCNGGGNAVGGVGGHGSQRFTSVPGGNGASYNGTRGLGGSWGRPATAGTGGSGGSAGDGTCLRGQGGAGGGWGGGGGGGYACSAARSPGGGGDAGWAVRVLSGSITLSGGNDTTHIKGWVN